MEKDQQFVLDWMMKYACGYKAARKKKDILPFLNSIDERRFREIMSELKHENHVCSLNTLGYWALPLHTVDPQEVYYAKRSWLEMRSRALSMLEDCDRNIKELATRVKQPDLLTV